MYLKIDDDLGLSDAFDSQEITLEPESFFEEEDESSYSRFSVSELNEQLDNAVSNENYELAAKIRDEISNRSQI